MIRSDVVRLGPRGRRVAALAMTALAMVAVVPIQLWLDDLSGKSIGFLVTFAVIVVAASLGGLSAGLLATALGALLEATYFLEPTGQLSVRDPGDLFRLVVFCGVGVLISWLAWLRASAETHARAARASALEERDRAEVIVRRLRALQTLATELVGAIDTNQITALVLEHGMAALQADGATVFMIESDGRSIVPLRSHGTTPDATRAGGRLPIDVALPAAQVANTGRPVFIDQPDQYLRQYDTALEGQGLTARAISIAVVPLAAGAYRFGSLAFIWNGPHPLTHDRQLFISALGRLAAAAIDRGRLFDAESAARRASEDAQRNLDLLAKVGRVMGMTLDYETTLHRLATVALPLLGTVGVVNILEDGAPRRLVATTQDDLAEAVAALEASPVDLDEPSPVNDVLQDESGSAMVLDRAAIHAGGRGRDQARALETIDPAWALVVPIRVLDRTIGVLSLLRQEDRRYDTAEIAVAEELGRRAGRALENTRLHAEVARLADREIGHAAELEAVLAAIGEGILVADPNGAIRSSNAAAVRLLGGRVLTVAEVRQRLVTSDVGHPSRLPTEPMEYQLAGRPDRWVELTTYPIPGARDASLTSSVVVCRDVTAFRQGQALREAFLGLLSHELRTPVTTIYGGASVLLRPGPAVDAQARAEVLADIAAESDRLYRLVEDLMVLARFDEGLEIADEPTLLQHLVPAVVDQERSRWPSVTFEASVPPDLPVVRGDETAVEQVLRNLLSNAAKYGNVDGTISVEAEATDPGVVVRILDRGRGIDPAEAAHLFDPFYRSPNTASMASGSGIGLYVSRRLIDAMDGRIWAAPREGGGSEFGFSLRCYPESSEP